MIRRLIAPQQGANSADLDLGPDLLGSSYTGCGDGVDRPRPAPRKNTAFFALAVRTDNPESPLFEVRPRSNFPLGTIGANFLLATRPPQCEASLLVRMIGARGTSRSPAPTSRP